MKRLFTLRRNGAQASTNDPDNRDTYGDGEVTSAGLHRTRALTPWLVIVLLAAPRTSMPLPERSGMRVGVFPERSLTITTVSTKEHSAVVAGYPIVLKRNVLYSRAIEASHVLKAITPPKYIRPIIRHAVANGIQPTLLAALIAQETNNTWDASIENVNVNGTIDKGLAQANSRYLPYYKIKYGLQDPSNAEQSISFAAQYTAYLIDKKGNEFGAMCAYKVGEAGMPNENVIEAVIWILKKAKI